jgi:hypothetical protein
MVRRALSSCAPNNILYVYFGNPGGWGGQKEGRGATVHKYSSFVHVGNSSQAGSKIPTMSL